MTKLFIKSISAGVFVLTCLCSQLTLAQDSQRDVVISAYMADLQKRIKANWHPPKGKTSTSAKVLFKISKNGRLISEEISRSTNNDAMDAAALKGLTAIL